MAASPRGSTRARGAAKGSPRGVASTTARMDGQAAMRGGEGEFGVERTVGASAGGADGASARHARDERKEAGVDDQTQAPSDVDDERIDGACDGFRLMSKAPPLTADMIDALNDVESRRVLARWSARMRSVKRRIEDCAHQFPTSSLVLVFTKPFRSADNQRKWAEEEFAAFGPIASAARDGDAGSPAALSGAQVLRRTVADLTGFKMNKKQLARASLDGASSRVVIATAEEGASAAGDSLEDLFEKLKTLVPSELHEHCASVLVASGAVRKSGTAADRRIVSLAEQFNRRRAYDRRPRTMDEAVAVLNELNRRAADADADAS